MAPKVHFAPPKPALQINFERDFYFGQKSVDGWAVIFFWTAEFVLFLLNISGRRIMDNLM